MFDKIREMNKLRQMQAKVKKEMESVRVTVEEGGVEIVMRGDNHVEQVVVDGEERKDLKDVYNKALKESRKKMEQKMRGMMGELGLPGF